jgi:hypothetical protein
MNVTQSVVFKNISANSSQFSLLGGKYAIVFNATGTGTASLAVLGADLATYVPVETSITTTPNYQVVDLPPGQFVFQTTGFTAVNVSITRVPS